MTGWPKDLDNYPESFRAELDKLVREYGGQAKSKAQRFRNSEVSESAKVIARRAFELLRLIQDFREKTEFTTVFQNTCDEAMADIRTWIPDISERDEGMFRAGMGGFEFEAQRPLIGLGTYMEIIHRKHAGRTSKSTGLERVFVKRIVIACGRAGIPSDRKGSAITRRIIAAAFDRVNDGADPSALLMKPLPAREISRIRTAFAKYGNSMEFFGA